jgi:hypothetical protein
MDYGSKIVVKDADKNVGKLPLNPGEVVVFIGTCSNWVPVALDWIAVTNQRLLSGSNLPVKVNWESALHDITHMSPDGAKNALTVTTSDGKSMTIKKVPSEDHAAILGHLNAAAGVTAPVVAAPVAEKKEGALAKFGAALKEQAAQTQADRLEKQAKEAEAQEAAKAAAGEVVHKGSFAGTAVWVYSGGYVRVDPSVLTKWQMSESATFERLLSVKFTTMTRDKSAGGRAIGFVASGGLSVFASNERIESFVSVATDRKVHKLACTREAGLALEAAGQGVIDAARAANAAQTVVVTQAVTAPAVPSVTDQLRELAGLHRDGILSDEEFAAKKADLLDRM